MGMMTASAGDYRRARARRCNPSRPPCTPPRRSRSPLGLPYKKRKIASFRRVLMIASSRSVAVFVLVAVFGIALFAQNPTQPLAQTPLQRDPLTPAPGRATGEGFGPYKTMVVRGAMLIDGTGGPPRGPVD